MAEAATAPCGLMPDLKVSSADFRRYQRGEISLEEAQQRRGRPAASPHSTTPQPAPARVRQAETRGEDGLNITERRYRDEVLEPRLAAGEISGYWGPCPLKLRVGVDWRCAFEPDFLVQRADGTLEVVDVKGTRADERADGSTGYRPLYQDDARVKLQALAERLSIFHYTVAFRLPKSAGGAWQEESV